VQGFREPALRECRARRLFEQVGPGTSAAQGRGKDEELERQLSSEAHHNGDDREQ